MTNTQAPQEATSAVPSDRLWLRSELMGTQVITRDTGRRLGLVGEVVVDIDRREVVALGLRDNPLTRFLPGLPRWLPLDQIRQVGDVILVDTIDSLSENFVPERFNKVINCQVITESGDQLGRVLGFSFDIETGELLTLVMGALGVPLLGEGVLSTWEMPVDEIVSSGPDRIIVYEGAEEKLKQLNSGFLEKLGVGNSGWEESERERYRVNLVPVENQLTSGESVNDDQRLLEQSQEIFEEEEMEYVELQDSEEQQYNKELRYLDEPNQSSIYSETDEDEVNYSESQFKNRTDDFQAKFSSKDTKNKSKIIRDKEPIDVEPLEDLTTNNSQDMISNDKELIDIEDPW
ncbi:photosystem reaction center subunit H [Prochlorococcus marinus XMU1403]|uniref:PRC-barrel domain-containing protein n=1 Tax=Prochlorococcus marinus TaxID=1219 RepID=UPI000D9EE498|nr:PRC-barrel domain-containing protein [Prochlorococcus marinus]MBW3048559.1 photosystem reaction center subunit H [Prochlorococcus marinus str. MU1403]PYE03438.1 photosystem reaction center subunit H [Prochlorococcus marinus XMU1403]